MTEESPAVEVGGLSVRFDRYGCTTVALRNLSITVPRGQWVLIIGWNGSGKSTLLRTLAAHHSPSAGEVKINGDILHRPNSGGNGEASGISRWLSRQRLGRISPAVKYCFYVHQNPAAGTVANLTVFDHLFQVDPMAGWWPRRCDAERYERVLARYGLADRLRQQTATLSGGERQLLTLLIADLISAEILLLDEPLAALDPHKARQCTEQILSMHARGKTILQVTHDIQLAATLGDRVVGLRNGRVEYDVCGNERNVDDIAAFLRRSEITRPECYD